MNEREFGAKTSLRINLVDEYLFFRIYSLLYAINYHIKLLVKCTFLQTTSVNLKKKGFFPFSPNYTEISCFNEQTRFKPRMTFFR